MKAFVLLKVATGQEKDAIKALQTIPSLGDVSFLLGEYDYLVTIASDDYPSLSRLVNQRIRKIPGVERTITLLEAPV